MQADDLKVGDLMKKMGRYTESRTGCGQIVASTWRRQNSETVACSESDGSSHFLHYVYTFLSTTKY